MDPLLGKAPDQTFVREIRAIVMSHPKVHGIHDLIVTMTTVPAAA